MTQVDTSYLRQYELKTIFSECGFKHLVCQVEDVEGEVSGLSLAQLSPSLLVSIIIFFICQCL